MLVLDTNVVIGYLTKDPRCTKPIDKGGEDGEAIALPTIVITELLSYPALTEDHRIRIEEFIRVAHTLPLTIPVAREAAKIRRQYRLTTIDAVIAATALVTMNGHLLTRDKAFKKVSGVPLIVIE